MIESEILTTIITSSFTKQDLLRRLRILREYLESKLFHQNGSTVSLEKFLKNVQASASDSIILQSWGEKFFHYFTKDNVYDVLGKINEKIKATHAVNVYLPFAPDEKEAKRLGMWFRENVGRDCLIELHVDRSMVGGLGLASNGYFRDYSLKHYIEKNKDKVRDIIAHYVASNV